MQGQQPLSGCGCPRKTLFTSFARHRRRRERGERKQGDTLGPFYIVAIYAYIKGKEWIRIPSIIYGSTLLTLVLVILGEEIGGTHATPHLPIVFLANLPWVLFPIYIIYRMWRYRTPFTQPNRTLEAQS